MMNQERVVHLNECECFSWKPILIGAIVGVGLTFLLNLFGVAIGLTAYTETGGTETLAFGGLIATAFSTVVAMFVAGWVSGYMGIRYCTKRHLGILYGFLTWSVALIIGIVLAGFVQDYVAYYSHALAGSHDYHRGSNAVAAAVSPTPENVKISAYIMFVLFFLGAFAATLGGHLGMRYVCRSERVA